MPRALHANCFAPATARVDLLLTDEPAVAAAAAAAGLETVSPEAGVNPDRSHAASRELWALAHSWFRPGGNDPTLVDGVSVGELAAYEAALTVLVPAARATLGIAALAEEAAVFGELVVVAPERTPGGARYDAHEQLAAAATAHAASHLLGSRLSVRRASSDDSRNVLLRDKYARTRDPEPLLPATRSRVWQLRLLRAANLAAIGRGRRRQGTLLVVDYNPTLAFSRAYLDQPERWLRLVRWIDRPQEALPTLRGGDLVDGPPMALPGHTAARPLGDLRASAATWPGAGFELAGVPLWPVLEARLLALLDRYGAFVAARAAPLRRRLERQRVSAVLVPFDSSPPVRLLIAVARSLGIPSFVLNDGFKADDVQIEGFSTDVALAWSPAVAEHYFARHPGRAFVTGNPRFTGPPARRRKLPARRPRVLVGSFTFSPVDLACRRGDAERFLTEVLEGIAGALPAVAEHVVVKLHPADEPAHYTELVARFAQLQVEVRSQGDVIDMLAGSDIYLTTYSTSLLEAAAAMPSVYYRVNDQRLGPPFEGDSYLGRRTACAPEALARLLADRTVLDEAPPAGWLERYLGPIDAVPRVVAAIEETLRTWPAASRLPAAPAGARRASAR